MTPDETVNNKPPEAEMVELSDRLAQLEAIYESEIRKFHDSFDDALDSFDKLKDQMKISLESKIDSEISPVKALSEDFSRRISQIELSLPQITADMDSNTVQELREELLEGIRLLGKRVTKAIQDMESRFDELSTRIDSSKTTENKPAEDIDKEFGAIKEGALLNPDNLDIISGEALERLAGLFRKQALGIKKFNEEQLAKIKNFEQLIKTYDEENTRIIENINKKIKKNFFILIVGFCLLIIVLKVLKLI